jgi:hypothetical protein
MRDSTHYLRVLNESANSMTETAAASGSLIRRVT